ncbi:Mu transposase C-terminal domain-containing protein [Cryobacterium glucosi]|nr:Mu transposase C-terminal domain-containing protein [Cryobacterium glucosi]
MNALNLAEPIHLIDGDYDFVEHQNPFIRLRKTSDGTYIDLNMAELARRRIGAHAFPTEPRTFDRLDKAQVTATAQWAEHVEELLTGVHPGHDTPRPEYDPASTTLNDRVQAKILELESAGIATSRATIMRKIKRFREQGSAGIIDRRLVRHDGPLDFLHPDVKDALCTVIANQATVSTGTKSRLIVQTHAELLKRFGAQAPAMPPESSMYRYIKTLTQGLHTTGSANTRQSLANRPRRTFALNTQVLPGAEVQVDSTPMDIFVRTASGKLTRPILTVMFDVATRSILACTLRLEATKGIDHVALLAQALTPHQNRPNRAVFRQLVQDGSPQCTLLREEERSALESTRPFVYPRRIMMDNGKDYTSTVFQAAAEEFHIDVTYSAPHTPTDKGHVERMFGSINTLFTQYLPGYVGRSPEFRGYNVEKEDLLSVFALYELFDDWVLKVWQNRPHSGLRDRMNPNIKISPNQAYAAATQVSSTLLLPITTDGYIRLLQSEYRAITSTGIAYNNRQYDSEELHPLRNSKSNVPGKKGAWEIKVDPYQPLAIWVRSAQGKWIECRTRNEDAVLLPHLTSSEPEGQAEERNNMAVINAALSGTPMHLPLTEETDPADNPESADEGTEISIFNPEED